MPGGKRLVHSLRVESGGKGVPSVARWDRGQEMRAGARSGGGKRLVHSLRVESGGKGVPSVARWDRGQERIGGKKCRGAKD